MRMARRLIQRTTQMESSWHASVVLHPKVCPNQWLWSPACFDQIFPQSGAGKLRWMDCKTLPGVRSLWLHYNFTKSNSSMLCKVIHKHNQIPRCWRSFVTKVHHAHCADLWWRGTLASTLSWNQDSNALTESVPMVLCILGMRPSWQYVLHPCFVCKPIIVSPWPNCDCSTEQLGRLALPAN